MNKNRWRSIGATQKRRLMQAMAGGLALCLGLGLCHSYGQWQGVREGVLRLHILANSDSPEDQAVKLQVRDAVVEASAGWLDEATDAAEARRIAQERLPELEQVARQTLAEAGRSEPVRASLKTVYFTTRQYGTVTLPAGEYEAVQLVIGAGAGHNWWCVVFPPLCAGAAADRRQLSDVLNREQSALVNDGERYVVRFKLVEWIEGFLHHLRR